MKESYSSEVIAFPAGRSCKKPVLSSYVKGEALPLAAVNAELQRKHQELFDLLNERLLRRFLRDKKGFRINPAPPCILAIEYRLRRYRGFAAKAVWSAQHGRKLDQLTLVFDRGQPLDVKKLASTLAHEMIHATQFADNTSGVHNYHNADFRERMRSIGLQTSQTGEPGGATIGVGMTHYIIEGGPFDRVMDEILAEGFQFPCEVAIPTPDKSGGAKPATKRDPSKVKYYCPRCGQNAWAKLISSFKCGRPKCHGTRLVRDW